MTYLGQSDVGPNGLRQSGTRASIPPEYRAGLKTIGLSQVGSAQFLGVSRRQAQRYASGESGIPLAVAKLIRLVVRLGLSADEAALLVRPQILLKADSVTLVVKAATRFELRDRLRTDHAAIGDNANATNREPLAQPVNHRNETAGVGGVAGPHLRANWPSVAVEQDGEDHLV